MNTVASDSAPPANESSATEREPGARPADVVLIHGVTEDGGALEVLRQRRGRVEAGAIRPAEEGRPIVGELVRLRPRKEFPLLCDVEVMLPKATGKSDVAGTRESETSHKGPAQVATDRYRQNWDLIWKRPGKDSDIPN
jgi:hypothetical protein